MSCVQIVRGFTHADMGVMPGTYVSSLVGDYIRYNLTEYSVLFNKRTFRNEYTVLGKYATYDMSRGILHIPARFVPRIADYLRSRQINVTEMPMREYTPRHIDLSVLPDFTDQPHQVKLIEKCSSLEKGVKGLAAQTGKGKTYCAIRSICNLGYAAVVIAPGLADQWIESFEKFTGERDSVYKIQEFKSLAMLMSSDWMPKVFVCSIQTMQAYCKGKDNYKELPYSFAEFFEHYGIGVKVVDECHLNFHATVKMDLLTNVPYNLYCSATFGQTNKYAARIFDVIYPKEIRYGIDEYDKYVTVHFFNYSGEVQENRCMRQRGYSHMRYEADLCKKPTKFERHFLDMFVPIINVFYMNVRQPGDKMLIFGSTVLFLTKIAERIRQEYPALKVVEYVGDATRDMLDDADIIVATVGKAGTGLDIKGLTTVYSTVSIRTSILSSQMLGRLRKISGKDLTYIDRCDVNLRSHLRHAEERKANLKGMAKKFYEYASMHDVNPRVFP